GNASATVSWTAPASNGGDVVTSYTVTTAIVSGSGSTPAPVSGLTSLSTIVGGLTNNVLYHFTVTATNRVGAGPGTTSTTVLPSSTPGVPSAPQNVAASFPNVSQRATITWQPPAVTGNSAIVNYSITGSPAPASPVVVSSAASTVDIDGLTGGPSYTFT